MIEVLNCVPVLAVKDPITSFNYYIKKLGFDPAGEPADDYAAVSIQGYEIHFHRTSKESKSGSEEPVYIGGVYFTVSDPDAYFSSIEKNGINIHYPPQDRPYGMRDFSIIDPDGYSLCFGKSILSAD